MCPARVNNYASGKLFIFLNMCQDCVDVSVRTNLYRFMVYEINNLFYDVT